MATDFSKYQTKTPTQTDTTDFSKYQTNLNVPTETQTTQQPSYVSRVLDSFSNLAQQVTQGVQQGAQAYQQGVDKGTFTGALEATGGLLRSGLRTAGAVASGAFTPITEAPIIKPLLEKGVTKALEIPGAKELVTTATNLAKQYPNASKDIQNIIDIATLGTGGVAEKPLVQEGKAIVSDIAQGSKLLLTPSEEAVQKNVVSMFNKAIKPTAKKTLGQAEKYDTNIVSALKTIKSNTDNLNIQDATGELITGRTPQTIPELAQAIEQTKDSVFKQYDSLAKQASGIGATIDTKPIADEVLKVAQNQALQLTNPEVIKYAENWAQRLQGFGQLDTETTQEVIKLMNKNLESFYKNPTYESASKVAIDAGIANNFRKALDTAIEGATGKEYQALKNQYSALKSIESDVVKASLREARKNVKGLLDYTDMFTSGQMVGGILSLNPAMFTQGAIERGFKEYIKFLNDPNRAIKNIFEKLDTGTSQTFNPASETGKFIKNPKLGLSIEDVTKNNPLYQEAKKYKSAEEFVNKSLSSKLVKATPTNYGETKTYKILEKYSANKQDIVMPKDSVVFRGGKDGVYYSADLGTAEGYAGSNPVIAIDISGKKLANFNKFSGGKFASDPDIDLNSIIKKALDDGYDGLYSKDNYGEVILPTKSQLTDIWNKANKK